MQKNMTYFDQKFRLYNLIMTSKILILGAQRFPDYNFVKYEELLDGKLSYKRFSNGFSVETPEMYICTGNGFSREPI